MDHAVEKLIAALHAAPFRYAICLTGGGTLAAGWLLSVPGGSRTVLDISVPYDENALAEYLGYRPASYCSTATSRGIANRAYDRANWLSPATPVIGVGCTASLRSDRPKKGDHRCHLSVRTSQQVLSHSLTLIKDIRSRQDEEEIVARLVLNTLAVGLGVVNRIEVPLLSGEALQSESLVLSDPLSRFLDGDLPAVRVESDGRCRIVAPPPSLLLSGSFNPLHEGHCALAETASRLTGKPIAFELAAVNAEKGFLSGAEVRRRLTQFSWRAPLWLTREPTFTGKAALFPGTTFIVGADTAARIVQPRFYGENAANMARSLDRFRSHGCRFLVAGRVAANGAFVGLDDLSIPDTFRDLFVPIPPRDFRFDASSTQLRAENGQSRSMSDQRSG